MRKRTAMAAAFLVATFVAAGGAIAQTDAIGIAATNRTGVASGFITIPVFVKDVSGTLAGSDKAACVSGTPCSRISEFEVKVDFDTKIEGCLVANGNCTFTPAGLLSGVKVTPANGGATNLCDSTAVTGCNFAALTLGANSLTYTISTNPPAALNTSTTDPVGDLMGYVRVKLASTFSGTTTATLDAGGVCGGVGQPGCAAYVGGNDNASGEYAANAAPGGGLTLNNAVVQKSTVDVDANGAADALTDGILILRRMFGFSGTTLTTGATATTPAPNRTAAANLQQYIDNLGKPGQPAQAGLLADIDGDGQVDALSDGILIIRYLFGFRGSTLINGAVRAGATRTTAAQIEAYLGQL